MQVTIDWKDDDPRVAFLMEHLEIESVESLFADMLEDNIDVWVDEHIGGNDECDLDTARPPAPGPVLVADDGPPVTHDGHPAAGIGRPAAVPSSQLEPELRWTPDVDDNRQIQDDNRPIDPSEGR